jgi:GNAT superfamily N-acetyltransferase
MDSFALSIREIALEDASAAAGLSGELGYPASAEAMSRRIASLTGKKDRIVFVATLGGNVAGWIEIAVIDHLASEPRVEICGLIVSDGARGQGIGRDLVARAEQWAVQQGVTLMLVRSRVTREAAHRFYLREGYERTKTSAVFTKELSGGT